MVASKAADSMKLRILSFCFQATALLCAFTGWLNWRAGKLHVAAWGACTAENLRTLNVRKVAGLRLE